MRESIPIPGTDPLRSIHHTNEYTCCGHSYDTLEEAMIHAKNTHIAHPCKICGQNFYVVWHRLDTRTQEMGYCCAACALASPEGLEARRFILEEGFTIKGFPALVRALRGENDFGYEMLGLAMHQLWSEAGHGYFGGIADEWPRDHDD
jgi:predicted RNA-binding Zn-ribbon protein involved in translation (DUF1610 family)